MSVNVLLLCMPSWSIEFPSHALAHVGGIIRNTGASCKVVDLNIEIYRSASSLDKELWQEENLLFWANKESVFSLFEKYRIVVVQHLSKLIKDNNYDLIAFTVNMSNRYFSLFTSCYIRSLKQKTPILFGGVDCFPSEYSLKFFEDVGAPDIICQGEAEVALPKFLRHLSTYGHFRTFVKGFAYSYNGSIKNNGEPELPELEDFFSAPAWDQFRFSLYKKPGDFATFLSRGCTNRCVFCSESINFKRHRVRKPEKVILEIKKALTIIPKYGKRPTIRFSDSLINGDINKFSRLCDLIIDSKVDIEWQAQARFAPEMTFLFLKKLKASGCSALSWGFESASDNVLSLMRKGYNHKIVNQILLDARTVGIESSLLLIVGFPGERISDFVNTLLFILRHRHFVDFALPETLDILRNTPLYNDLHNWGVEKTMRSPTSWYSSDKRNNLNTRRFRRCVMRNVISNPGLTIQGMVESSTLKEIDFNNITVASEIASLLYELWKVNGIATKMACLLAGWEGKVLSNYNKNINQLDYWHPKNIPLDISLENWFLNDKNSYQKRSIIWNCIFESLKMIY